MRVLLEDVSKVYRIYDRPIDRFKEMLGFGKYSRDFWALKHINLKIDVGETVGIIGTNGSGKSTLLQIIAGTLRPTSGKIEVNGRVSALLELGLGFHPELTGRDNIKLLSSLMNIELTPELEEEIYNFAEIGEFFDRPLRTYSSGMFVRLAFAFAVSVDPDILIVDEALSVGDIYFQKKSFDKILSFKEDGRTLIICSHSMYHINHLCSRAVWLRDGQVVLDGPAQLVTLEYEKWIEQISGAENEYVSNGDAGQDGVDINFINPKSDKIVFGEPFIAEVKYIAPFDRCHIGIGFSKSMMSIIFATSTQLDNLGPLPKAGVVRWRVDELNLLPGRYEFFVAIMDETGNVISKIQTKMLDVHSKGEGVGRHLGIVEIEGSWHIS